MFLNVCKQTIHISRAFCNRVPHAVPFLRNDFPYSLLKTLKCPKFEKRRCKNLPFYWTFLPLFGYTARMPLFSRISPDTSRSHISENKRCFNVKSSTCYFRMKTKILAGFQICICVPLIRKVQNEIERSIHLESLSKKVVLKNSWNHCIYYVWNHF